MSCVFSVGRKGLQVVGLHIKQNKTKGTAYWFFLQTQAPATDKFLHCSCVSPLSTMICLFKDLS